MDLVTIGVIVNTHGLKGTCKVKSFTDFKNERYKKGNPLYIAFRNELIQVTVKSFRTVKGLEYIDFEEFNHINQIEKFKKCDLKISSEFIHDLEDEDEFYFEELIGMEVYTDQLIGVCTDIREVPQGELLEIKKQDNKKALIPFRKEFVKEVNKEEKRILLQAWEGLI